MNRSTVDEWVFWGTIIITAIFCFALISVAHAAQWCEWTVCEKKEPCDPGGECQKFERELNSSDMAYEFVNKYKDKKVRVEYECWPKKPEGKK
jgi:cytidine deaminase